MDSPNRSGPRIIAVRETQLSRHSESLDHDGKVDEYVSTLSSADVVSEMTDLHEHAHIRCEFSRIARPSPKVTRLQINDYIVVKTLGRGGFAVVKLARIATTPASPLASPCLHPDSFVVSSRAAFLVAIDYYHIIRTLHAGHKDVQQECIAAEARVCEREWPPPCAVCAGQGAR